MKRRELAYRGSYSEPEVRGKTVILIDDEIALGPPTANCDRRWMNSWR